MKSNSRDTQKREYRDDCVHDIDFRQIKRRILFVLVYRWTNTTRSWMLGAFVQFTSSCDSLFSSSYVSQTPLGNNFVNCSLNLLRIFNFQFQSNKLKQTTGYTIQSFYSIMEKIFWLVAKASVHDKWAITKKYRHVKHHCVASIEIPTSLPYVDMNTDGWKKNRWKPIYFPWSPLFSLFEWLFMIYGNSYVIDYFLFLSLIW